jgi:hypothetical protein
VIRQWRKPATLVVLALCVALSACTKKETDDYCRNHYLFHAEHVEETGTFNVHVGDDGSLVSELVQPVSVFSGDNTRRTEFVNALRSAEQVYSAGTDDQCSHSGTSVVEEGGVIRASYEATCDAASILKKVDVSIFDLADEIDELEVTIVTPATSKHFAISRQCSAAIFRLEKQ